MAKTPKPTQHLIMAVDPGGAAKGGRGGQGGTGVAKAIVDLEHGMVESCLQNAKGLESMTYAGTYLGQAKMIAEQLGEWELYYHVEHSLPLDRIHLVCEDFVLRKFDKGRNLLMPVRVQAALEGRMLRTEPLEMQQPSDMLSFATHERMKKWGVWVPGKKHENEARGHLAVKLDKLLKVHAT